LDVVQINRVAEGVETAVIPQVWVARNFWQRLRGLLGKAALTETQGLLIKPCRQIHTVGMSYPLDIVFVDSNGFIVKISQFVKPFRQASSHKAFCALELAAGVARHIGLTVGDQLTW
jgi:uncharacterized membrane protein (UPF0127 family)